MTNKRQTKPPHEPTRATRELVQLHAMVGTRQEAIASIIGIDPKYCDVIIKRWQDFTGKRAVLESSGDAFNDMLINGRAEGLKADIHWRTLMQGSPGRRVN